MTDASVATITVNGAAEPFVAAGTLTTLLSIKGIDPDARGVAVALNGRVVPRTAWADTPLAAGDAVEIVRARPGG